MRWRDMAWVVAVGVIAAVPARADLVVYDDALQNGFEDWSWGGGGNFANSSPVHGGTASIALTGNNYNAISLAKPGAGFTAAAFPSLRLWVHGGSGSNQALTLALENTAPAAQASVALNTYIPGGGPTAGTWKQVTVPLASAFASIAQFDRINIQSNAAGSQPTVYFDDIALVGATLDPIFANGFEGGTPPAGNGLVQEQNVTVAGMLSDRFTWRDSLARPRVAVLAQNNGAPGPGGARGGALREFRYQTPANATRVAGVTNYGNAGYAGFGYVVSHSAWAGNVCIGNDSPLGGFIGGQFQRVFTGRHHAIFRFTQNYPRNCRESGAPQSVPLPVTIDWVFATGRDHPLWAVTFDMSSLPANYLNDDSRAPYGELVFDGDGSQLVSGVAWGDLWKFTSTSAPLTLGSSWTWNQPNTVPYVKEWITGTDATMGLVQTQPLLQHDAGGGRNPWWHDMTQFWNKTSADGPAGDGYLMPWQGEWPYQSIAWSLGATTPTSNTRLTWGTQFGFLGQTSYESNTNAGDNGPLRPGHPRQSYSVYVVLGAHSTGPVEAQRSEIEVVQTLTLSASIGSVATGGPAGINRPDSMSYTPAGFDPVYGALTFNATGNALDANIAVGAGTLRHPLVIVRGYGAAAYPTLKLNGQTLVMDQDWFPSLRAGSNELWITLNRDLAGAANHVVITP
ncbi:MAG: hypothetical protein F9K31_10160 [Dokdonella sp.]|nr:MAG: hypothetical protein F9K31_10160 [Dokdonella sp.]